MARAGKWKLGLGIGSGLILLVVVGVLGTATWYAGRINEEYKEVRDSEEALLLATEKDEGYRPPAGGIPAPERIEVFLAVREELVSWRRTMATASEEFGADREKQRAGGVRDFLKLVNTGSDLMPVYAGFWTARNEALLAHGMGPGEYRYFYRLIYETWLGVGRPAVSQDVFPADKLNAAFEPYRDRITAVFASQVDLVELIFQMDLK